LKTIRYLETQVMSRDAVPGTEEGERCDEPVDPLEVSPAV